MIPYYLLLLIPFLIECFHFLSYSNRKDGSIVVKHSNISIVVFFTLWCGILALRSINCGIDLKNYEWYFDQIVRLNFFDVFKYNSIEPLYCSFNWICGQICLDFRFFLVVSAILSTLAIGCFFWKESENALLTILLFITNAPYGMYYSGLRQSIAMLFAIPAYYLTRKKKIFPFILIVLLSTYFHSSAFILFLLYPVFHTSLKSRYFLFIVLLVLFIFFFNARLFFVFLPFLGEKFIDAYGKIQETNAYSTFILFFSFLLLSFLISDEKKMNQELLGLRNVLVIITIIQCFAPINPIAMRMNYYFIMLFPIIIPKILNRPKAGWGNFIVFYKWAIIIFLSFFFFFYTCNESRDVLNLYPYYFYWE